MTNHTSIETDIEEQIVDASGTGWLLPLLGGHTAAVGESEMVYVFPFEPEVFPIPNTPSYARGVIVWRNRLVPLIDLNAYFYPDQATKPKLPEKSDAAAPRGDTGASESGIGESAIEEFVALFAFQSSLASDGRANFGALLLNDVPERVVVSDGHVCELPDDLNEWRSATVSCFSHEAHGPIPILDLSALFAGTLKPASSQSENATQTLA